MTNYALYLDDSGHPDDQPFVVVAGYIASEVQWLALDTEWREVLAKFGLDLPFHMTTFMHTKYSSFKRDQILYELASVTKKNTLFPFVYAIDVVAWKRVNNEFALEECHGAPFAFAVRGLAKELNEWKANNLKEGEHLLTFMEQGTKHFGQMEEIFQRDRIPALNRVPKEMVQVQPCDVLAWEAFKWLKAGSPNRPSKNMARLTNHIRVKQPLGGIFYEADIRRICADTDVMLRSALKPGDTIRFHSNLKRVRRRTIK